MGIYGSRDGKFFAKKVIVEDKVPVQYVIPLTVAESTSAILTGEDINANGTTAYTNTGLLIQPPYAMQLHLNWNVAGASTDDDALALVGKDAKGDVIKETLTISSAASGNVYTERAFSYITSMTPSAVLTSTDIGIGFRKSIGVPHPIKAAGDIYSHTYDGTFATTDSFTVGTYDTVTLPTMAASKAIQICYKSEFQ